MVRLTNIGGRNLVDMWPNGWTDGRLAINLNHLKKCSKLLRVMMRDVDNLRTVRKPILSLVPAIERIRLTPLEPATLEGFERPHRVGCICGGIVSTPTRAFVFDADLLSVFMHTYPTTMEMGSGLLGYKGLELVAVLMPLKFHDGQDPKDILELRNQFKLSMHTAGII